MQSASGRLTPASVSSLTERGLPTWLLHLVCPLLDRSHQTTWETLFRRVRQGVYPPWSQSLRELQDASFIPLPPVRLTDAEPRHCPHRPINHDHDTFPHGHEEVTFVGRPFPLEDADAHFARLRRWGLTFSTPFVGPPPSHVRPSRVPFHS